MALINCNECGAQISDKATTCIKCGAPVVKKEIIKCFECGTELEKGAKTCSNCGADQGASEQPVVSVPPMKESIKPQVSSSNANTRNEPKKKSSALKWTLIGVGAVVVIVGTIFFINSQNSYSPSYDSNGSSYSSGSNSYEPPREKTPEELRQELIEKEKQNPLDYLTVTYSLDYKVFSGKDVIKGTIYNSATMATFKDVTLRVSYSTGTDTELGSENFVVYKYVTANSSANFEIKTYSPSATKKIGVTVVSAVAE